MKSKKEKLQDKKEKIMAKKEKIVQKLKGVAKVASAITLVSAMSGCQSTPSRAQTQTITDCVFYVMVPPSGATNASASAVGTVGDLFAQNMVIENSGTETLTPSQTISPTTTLSYGVGGGDSLASLLTGLKNMLGLGSGTAATTACAAGKCVTP